MRGRVDEQRGGGKARAGLRGGAKAQAGGDDLGGGTTTRAR